MSDVTHTTYRWCNKAVTYELYDLFTPEIRHTSGIDNCDKTPYAIQPGNEAEPNCLSQRII
jgi:hypothetical protein